MTPDFEILSKSQSRGPILAAIFNENIHEVITVGPGYLTLGQYVMCIPKQGAL